MWNNFTVVNEMSRPAWREVIARKKEHLDRLRPVSAEAVRNLEHYYDLEITYASNAIEGNTLSYTSWWYSDPGPISPAVMLILRVMSPPKRAVMSFHRRQRFRH